MSKRNPHGRVVKTSVLTEQQYIEINWAWMVEEVAAEITAALIDVGPNSVGTVAMEVRGRLRNAYREGRTI